MPEAKGKITETKKEITRAKEKDTYRDVRVKAMGRDGK